MRYVLISLLLVASTANAEDWQQVAELDSNGSILYFDAARVTDVKGFRAVWFKALYTSDQLIPAEYVRPASAGLRSYRSEKSLRYFSCQERTSAVLQFHWSSGRDDDKAGVYSSKDFLTFRAVEPGTVDERMLEAACSFAGAHADANAARLPLPGDEARKAKLKRVVNPDDYYPSGSKLRGEQGSPLVRVCVDPSGLPLREPVVKDTSGFPDLDDAAIEMAKDSSYVAGTEDGQALPESCVEFKIRFSLSK